MGAELATKTTLTRARIEQALEITPARKESSDLRVEFVWDLFVHGEYVRGRTDKELAAIWGIGVDAVHQYSAVASKLLRLQFAPERHEEIKATLLNRILRIGDEAANRTEQVLDIKGRRRTVRRPDMRTALAAVVEFAQLLGIRTTKHEHRVTTADLSDAELHAKLAEIVAADPKLQESLGAMGFRREVVAEGQEVPDAKER